MTTNKFENTKSLVMNRKSFSSYSFSCNDLQLIALGDFLGDDCVQFGIDWLFEWALDPNRDETGGNITTVRKVAKSIEISWDVDNTNTSCVRLSMREFLSMLERWKTIEALHPTSVRITLVDNSKVKLEALDAAMPSDTL